MITSMFSSISGETNIDAKLVSRLPNVSLGSVSVREAVWQTYISKAGSDAAGDPTMISRADPRCGDDRLGADAGQRGDDLGLPPQHRQQRRDHAGAQDAEDAKDALDRVRQLNADHRVGLEAERAQARRDRPDDAVGLRVGELPRLAVGKVHAVIGVGERDGVGIADRGTAEQVVERGALGLFQRGRADDHVAFSAHQVSGR